MCKKFEINPCSLSQEELEALRKYDKLEARIEHPIWDDLVQKALSKSLGCKLYFRFSPIRGAAGMAPALLQFLRYINLRQTDFILNYCNWIAYPLRYKVKAESENTYWALGEWSKDVYENAKRARFIVIKGCGGTFKCVVCSRCPCAQLAHP